MINRFDQNIAVRKRFGAQNAGRKCFELRNRMEGSIDREGDVFSRQRFFLMKFHTFAQLENKTFRDGSPAFSQAWLYFSFIEI